MPLVNDDPVEEMVEIGEEDWVPDPGERKDKYKYRAVLRMRRGYKWGGGRYRAITGSEDLNIFMAGVNGLVTNREGFEEGYVWRGRRLAGVLHQRKRGGKLYFLEGQPWCKEAAEEFTEGWTKWKGGEQ